MSASSVHSYSSSQPRHSRKSSETSQEYEEPHHVEYVLVAEFEIDRGSEMEHQYPTAISGDEHMLAQLMLPDGAHARNQDWTIFFLHKDVEQIEGGQIEVGGQPPLIYVLNLVITKKDTSVKRGAIVKAMAICTRHPFLHIYKPILLLALEEYFKYPTIDTLAKLYNSVNEMDLTPVPRLSILECQILASSDNKEMFIEKFEETMHGVLPTYRSPSAGVTPSPCTTYRSPSALQGDGVTPADRSASALSHLTGGDGGLLVADKPDKPKTYIGLAPGRKNGLYAITRDSHEFETRVVYNGIPIPVKVPVAILPETVGDFSLIQLITTFSTPHSQNPQPFPLHPHLTTNGPYTHPIIVLVNALLTQKRIVFLSYEKPSGEVVDHVLAACALASGGVLRGFTRHAFPYTDLSKIDELLLVQGFIAGVKNPTFAHHDDWWDIICNLDTGRIKISPSIKQVSLSDVQANFGSVSNPDSGDNAFMEDVLNCVSSRFGENAVRTRWRDWIVRFTRIAAAFEEMVYGASALWIGHEDSHAVKGHGYVWLDEQSKLRDLTANSARIEGWRNTRSYYAYVQDQALLYKAKPVKALDLHHQIDRLRTLRLSYEESARIFLALRDHVVGYEAINQLLCVTPEYQSGLFSIAIGLFHPQQRVRFAVVELLERLSTHTAGKHFFNSMNRFQKLAFIRLQQDKMTVPPNNPPEMPTAESFLSYGSVMMKDILSTMNVGGPR